MNSKNTPDSDFITEKYESIMKSRRSLKYEGEHSDRRSQIVFVLTSLERRRVSVWSLIHSSVFNLASEPLPGVFLRTELKRCASILGNE